MNTPSTHSTSATPWWKKILSRTLVFSFFGLIDGVIAVASSALPLAEVFWALPLVVGLWTLVGWGLACAQQLAWRVLGGPSADDRARAWTIDALRRRWQAHGTPEDRRWLAGALSILIAIGLAESVAFLWLAYLIEYRHGAKLIAVTFILGQLGLIAVASALAVGMRRGLCALFDRLGSNRAASRWIGSRLLLAGGPAIGAVIGTLVLIKLWEIVEAVDGVSLMLVGAALALQPLGARPFRALRRARWGVPLVIAVPVLCITLLPVLSAAPEHRLTVVKNAKSGKIFYASLQKLTDFDGDQFAAYPYLEDCAPFDAEINPLALEIPHNGVDENCDGEDSIPPAYQPRRVAAKLPEGPPPNLVLITIDATRADHLGFMGYKRETSPNLDALAARSTVFLDAYSSDSGTGPSLWSLMTGKKPFQAALERAHRFPPRLAKSETTLAEHLSRAGYRTAALTCGYVFQKSKWDIHRGFKNYREICSKLRIKNRRREERLAEIVTHNALKTIGQLEKGKDNAPYFLWLHYYDPHDPYFNHPDQDLGEGKIDRYDEEIVYTDRHLKSVLDRLTKASDGERQTIIAITADHGENFGEHGRDPHARTLYKEVTHVPLVFYIPEQPGRRIAPTVANGDIFPTFLELARVPIPDDCTQVSQAPVLYGADPDPQRLVFQENSFTRPKRRHVKAVVGRGYQLILDLTTVTIELYDLRADPKETKNLYGEGLEIEEILERFLRAFIQTTKIPPGLED